MSFWHKIIDSISNDRSSSHPEEKESSCYVFQYAFVDAEIGINDKRIHDIGALRQDGAIFHAANRQELLKFIKDVRFICGHNIIHHDAKYLLGGIERKWILADTLYMSPLLFPERPYHHLLKDDKLISEHMNNPVNDCEKARDLMMDEIAQWNLLPDQKKSIYATLLHGVPEFEGFLELVDASPDNEEKLPGLILAEYKGKICGNSNIREIIATKRCELAYALALIDTTDYRSVTPAWVLHNYPDVENVIRLLRHARCKEGCIYCNSSLDVRHSLKMFFGYDSFRTYDGEPLQENAARCAVDGRSLLAIFPTGGGKSLTFQLPALMEGRSVHGLTVVISPLQSLMKDQVDNLAERGITDAVTISGLLDPISRSLAFQRVMDGDASLLYISPEMLRSNTIRKILLSRHVTRFVIDEAHCFSSWGQDFRVDYLYIGKFIREYQKEKKLLRPIPVSCFTATAKQKVIQDISDYFKRMLGLDLELFASRASRTNLHYSVIHADSEEEKYIRLRSLISSSSCPTIVYVSRTKRTKIIADKLSRDGFKALPFNGKMDADEKISNQDAFMTDQARIIVATSAFGMGVDKKDVGLVIHYDISDSLENYVQEAGRAGRDPELEARCYVLYSDSDLDSHFMLLNQTKLSISEIQQVWKAVRGMTKERSRTLCSALEIARAAGWDDSVADIETRVRTALAALEQAGFLERGNNAPHVYATGITVRNVDEARIRISESLLFEKDEVENAVRIIKSLISEKYISKSQNAEAESRVDYLADILGLSKKEIVSAVERMREEGILADTKDITAYLYDSGMTKAKAGRQTERFASLERYILSHIPEEGLRISCKQLNDNAQKDGISTSTEKNIRTLLYFLTIKGYIRKKEDFAHNISVSCQTDKETLLSRFEKRQEICRFALEKLYAISSEMTGDDEKKNGIQFSVVELLGDIKAKGQDLLGTLNDVNLADVEEALLYLSKIGVLKLEGGFLVLYNAMDIRRIKEAKYNYKKDDYRMLDEFYKQKIQQVHIVGEYANLMVQDYNAALQFVQDYFQMDFKLFVSKYFREERSHEIERNMSPRKYRQLYGNLSERQREIIRDDKSRCIVVAAGPGSGKTRLLVHKLASLLWLEDVKHEQLLMLTFSRAAATEFKQRLMDLIGDSVHYVEIKTFHSYCFDLLGKIGNPDEMKDVVSHAAQMIRDGEVEPSRIGKTVLVIDEAQDMSSEEYSLVNALMAANEEMRVIAVGDDDQNIYEFRGSDSHYMRKLLEDSDGRIFEMTENYRSSQHIVSFANAFANKIKDRMKSDPITSMSTDDGSVDVIFHASRCMYEPLVHDMLQNQGNGSSCVLTQTNEEAVIIAALLRRYGIKSKLIQGMDDIKFWNTAEVRMFIRYLDAYDKSPLIADEVWEEAKCKTFSSYATSSALPYLQRCIKLFEQTYKTKYLTDFKEFVFESNAEDFCDLTGAECVVSTIHKSKGREFDNVYMLIAEPMHITDEVLRRYYVGITRAKHRLSIHTDSQLFSSLPADRIHVDQKMHEMPDEIMLQLSHKDVYLDFFKSRKKEILSLRAGDKLSCDGRFLYDAHNGISVCQLSLKMQENLRLFESRNYHVSDAVIRFIVAWRPKDAPKEEEEHAVILADLTLQKKS